MSFLIISPHYAGFWSGWLPRAIGDVLLVTLTSGITFAVNKYLIHDQEMAKYTGHVAGFITSSIVYPFTVVSNTMIVSRFASTDLLPTALCTGGPTEFDSGNRSILYPGFALSIFSMTCCKQKLLV